MKQHLVLSDLKTLTDTGKERLREWWKPTWGDITSLGQVVVTHTFNVGTDEESFMACAGDQTPDETLKSDCLPLPSIGQLIQFLDEQSNHVTDELSSFMISRGEYSWYVNSMGNPFEHIKGINIECPELIDALWKAAVDILNKEK